MSSAAAILKFLASLFSIYGCCQYCNDVGGDGVDRVALDAEQGTYVPPALEEDVNMLNMSKSLNSLEEPRVCKTAGICSYVFQIIYQENDKKDETATDSSSKKVDSDSEEEEQDTHQKEKGVSNKKKKLICWFGSAAKQVDMLNH